MSIAPNVFLMMSALPQEGGFDTFQMILKQWLPAGFYVMALALFLGSLINTWFIPRRLRQCLRSIALQETDTVRLRYNLELAEITLKSIGDAVITTDADGLVQWLNPIAEKLTGWTVSECKGMSIEAIFQIFDEKTREPVSNPALRALASQQVVSIPDNTILVSRHGKEYSITDSAAPIRDSLGSAILGSVTVFYNQTQTRELVRAVEWQASHDSLTRLLNRNEFEQRAEQAISTVIAMEQEHVICFVDLDRFKIVNDTSGHQAGDSLLQQVADLIQANVRGSDIVGRLGGDEFAILLYNANLSVGVRVAEKVRAEIAALRFQWEGRSHSIGASIGLTAVTSTSRNLIAVMQAADNACYTAKEDGRNRVHVNTPGDAELRQRQIQMGWLNKLDEALALGRFQLFGQPIQSLQAGTKEEHYEVLLRLIDEDGSYVSPAVFLPIAERFGRMVAVDRWVIKHLFEQHGESYRRHWRAGDKCLYAINLSGQSLNDADFAVWLEEQIIRFAIPPQYLCFEITETSVIANLDASAQFLQRLRALGCRTALDDFGVGYCSFSYLQRLEVDFLKIDGRFVTQLLSSELDEAIIRSMVAIAKVQGIRTIAEFVESEAILERLRELEVDFGQGYSIGKPAPLEVAPDFEFLAA